VEGETLPTEIEAIFSKNRVNDGDAIKVSLVGDVLKETIHNWESPIQLLS